MTTDWKQRRDETQLNILRRYAKLLGPNARSDTTEMADSPMERPASIYTDTDRLDQEMEHIFQGLPIVAGLSVDIPNSGDHIVFEECGPSLLVVRNSEGSVNAFLNMCTHRGAKLKESCGASRSLCCPFHAWTFDLNGNLTSVPGEAGFKGMDKASKGLVKVPCVEWGGLIFVKARAGAEDIDIESYLGEFAPELLQIEIDKVVPVKSTEMLADCNWKYALDTYGEGYHFARLHAETVHQLSISNVAVFDPFECHHRITFPTQSSREWIAKPESEWPKQSFGAVHFLFPNTVLFYGSLSEGMVLLQIFRLFPDGEVGKLRTKFAVYAPSFMLKEDGKLDDETFNMVGEMGLDATAHVVQSEDYWVAANGWSCLKDAPADFNITYGANEPALQAMHKNIEKVLQG